MTDQQPEPESDVVEPEFVEAGDNAITTKGSEPEEETEA